VLETKIQTDLSFIEDVERQFDTTQIPYPIRETILMPLKKLCKIGNEMVGVKE
jgi:hypothetical protein